MRGCLQTCSEGELHKEQHTGGGMAEKVTRGKMSLGKLEDIFRIENTLNIVERILKEIQ